MKLHLVEIFIKFQVFSCKNCPFIVLACLVVSILVKGDDTVLTFWKGVECHRKNHMIGPVPVKWSRPHFYQTRSAWSMDQGSNENHSPVNNFAPTVTKFCVMWEGQALPHDPKFGNCRDKIVDSRSFLSWSLIHGSSWSGLIKVGPEGYCYNWLIHKHNKTQHSVNYGHNCCWYQGDTTSFNFKYVYNKMNLKMSSAKWRPSYHQSMVLCHITNRFFIVVERLSLYYLFSAVGNIHFDIRSYWNDQRFV